MKQIMILQYIFIIINNAFNQLTTNQQKMKNQNKKKYSKRFLKSSTKEYPLVNLYILILVIVECIIQAFNFIYLKYILKPLILILMIYYIHNKTINLDYLICNITKIGLILSLIGDFIMLTEEQENQFFAKIFYALSHLCYILGLNIQEKLGNVSRRRKILLILACIVCFIVILSILYFIQNLIKNKKLTLVTYLISLLMVSSSIMRYNNTSPRSYQFAIIGSFLLLISDLIFTITSSYNIANKLSSVGIMLTYYCGQYLIMHGSILHSTLQDTIERYIYKNY